MADNELKTIAEQAKAEYMQEHSAPKDETPKLIPEPISPEEDEPVIFTGSSTGVVKMDDIKKANERLKEDIENVQKGEASKVVDQQISPDYIKTLLPDVRDNASLTSLSDTLFTEINEYRKKLIIDQGFTPEEADEAARNRLHKKASVTNTQYLEENPKVGIVTINKTQEDKIEFTPEEKEKLVKSQAIKLVVEEDLALSSIKIKSIDPKQKAIKIRDIEGYLSRYSGPLPVSGDFITFRGAQTIQLVSAVYNEDDSLADAANKKASLIYDKLIDGTNFNKFDDSGKIILTYEDFCNRFKFMDLDLALFYIYVASSMEVMDANLVCKTCNSPYTFKYNIKTLLNMKDIPEKFVAEIDGILGNKSNREYLRNIYEKNDKITRYRSPFTNNIYDIRQPTVSKAISILSRINETDATIIYLSSVAIFLSGMYVYDKTDDTYIDIVDKENTRNNGEDFVKNIIEAIQEIPETDLNMLFAVVRDMTYAPKFILTSACPNCGAAAQNELTIADAVFLKAQDMSVEIKE